VSRRHPAAGPLRADEVGYRGSGDMVLRGALFDVWNGQCCACWQPRMFAETEIEHLIPRTVDDEKLQDLIGYHGLGPGFHVDRPGNLALICGPCNNRKRDRILRTTGMTTLLDMARGRSREVIRRVRGSASANQVARGLMTAARADLSDRRARDEFLQHAPAVVQTLALLDEQRVDFLVPHQIGLNIGRFVTVSFTLDAQGRLLLGWIEQICGRTLTGLVRDGISDVVGHATARIEQAVRGACGGDTGSVESTRTDELAAAIHLDGLHRDGSRMTCRVSGQLDGSYNSLVHDAELWNGVSEIVYAELDVQLAAQFRLTISWDLATGSTDPPVTTVEITDFDIEAGSDRHWR
jgi:5-methylcytosine-specific restriction endonuclease McrA